MATILDFPEMQAAPRRANPPRARLRGDRHLPGVRYERWTDERPQMDATRVERDRLQLIEAGAPRRSPVENAALPAAALHGLMRNRGHGKETGRCPMKP